MSEDVIKKMEDEGTPKLKEHFDCMKRILSVIISDPDNTDVWVINERTGKAYPQEYHRAFLKGSFVPSDKVYIEFASLRIIDK